MAWIYICQCSKTVHYRPNTQPVCSSHLGVHDFVVWSVIGCIFMNVQAVLLFFIFLQLSFISILHCITDLYADAIPIRSSMHFWIVCKFRADMWVESSRETNRRPRLYRTVYKVNWKGTRRFLIQLENGGQTFRVGLRRIENQVLHFEAIYCAYGVDYVVILWMVLEKLYATTSFGRPFTYSGIKAECSVVFYFAAVLAATWHLSTLAIVFEYSLSV